MKNVSRRSFLKLGATAAGTACATQIPAPASAKPKSGKELATLIDIRKCIGCESCVEACRDVNGKYYPEPVKPYPKMYPKRVKVEDWSDKREVRDRLTPYNWVFIQEAVVKKGDEELVLTIPRRCMHCQNPPCADLCPWGAARKLDNGITVIDRKTCLGGKKCQVVCPWDIPQRQTGVGLYLDLLPSYAGNGVMYKCHRCFERIEDGELPACIDECPEQVQTIGPRDEIIVQALRIAKEINGHIYGIHENGGTNTIYVSPVPFADINEAIEKSPGRPHFNPVEDQMAHADNLAKAMVIAPIAGIAAAALKIYSTAKKLTSHKGDHNA